MNNKFDELTKAMAQSITRRGALKKFGVGVVAVLAASLGVESLSAAPPPKSTGFCEVFGLEDVSYTGTCWDPVTCQYGTSLDCSGARPHKPNIGSNPCNPGYVGIDFNKKCSL
jgi:hypothetical protein